MLTVSLALAPLGALVLVTAPVLLVMLAPALTAVMVVV